VILSSLSCFCFDFSFCKAKDLLTRDYNSDQKFSISTYSASGVVCLLYRCKLCTIFRLLFDFGFNAWLNLWSIVLIFVFNHCVFRFYLAAIRPLRVYVLGLIDLHVEIDFLSSVLVIVKGTERENEYQDDIYFCLRTRCLIMSENEVNVCIDFTLVTKICHKNSTI